MTVPERVEPSHNEEVTSSADGLGSTIRAWRDRLSPAAAGLPARHTRRAAGLRREELADLAGISVDYVVRLEQGRATSPSAQVVAALGRALRLTDAERDHLYRLAGLVPPGDRSVSDHITPGVARVVSRLGDAAVAVFAADWQLLWWNPGWAALLGDPSSTPVAQRNFARDMFPIGDTAPTLSRWAVHSDDGDERVRAAVASDLRRASGRFPTDGRLRRLISELTAGNDDFARLWAGGAVDAHREDHKTVHHAGVGPIEVDCDVLTDGDAELKIVVMTTEPGTEDESRFRLALVTGVESSTGSDGPQTRTGARRLATAASVARRNADCSPT